MRSQDVEAAGGGGPDGKQGEAEAAGGPGTGGGDLGGHGDLEAGVGVGAELETGVAEGEPVGLPGHQLGTVEEGQDGLQGLLHPVALVGRVDPHHEGVGGEGAGADPEHDPAPGDVVEEDHPVGQDQGLVVGEGGDPGAEPDVLGPLREDGDGHLGGGDDLVAGRVVLADPGLVEAELVEADDEFEVALDGQGRVLADGVERGDEGAEGEGPVHGGSPLRRWVPTGADSQSVERSAAPDDALVEGLEAEPAGKVDARLVGGERGHLLVDRTGVPAASAKSWAWQERSMVMNRHTASSTVWPTVRFPWLRERRPCCRRGRCRSACLPRGR